MYTEAVCFGTVAGGGVETIGVLAGCGGVFAGVDEEVAGLEKAVTATAKKIAANPDIIPILFCDV